MTVADYIMQAAVDHGIRHVFTVPGGFSMYLGEAAEHHPQLECVYTHHEQAAAVAAAGYFHASKTPALVIVTAGPGVLNTISGVAAAWLDNTPLLIVSGQVKRDDVGVTDRPRFMPVLPTTTIVKSLTSYATLVTDVSEIQEKMAKALAAMESGPVWVDVPLDVQSAEL